MSSLTIRPMLPADAALVASLHAESWRTAYREILSAAFLADEVDEERLKHWEQRLRDSRDDRQFGLVAVRRRRFGWCGTIVWRSCARQPTDARASGAPRTT